MLTRKLIKQKNQVVVNVPKQVCDDFGWKAGDTLRIFIVARGIIQIEKIFSGDNENKRSRFSLGETEGNLK